MTSREHNLNSHILVTSSLATETHSLTLCFFLMGSIVREQISVMHLLLILTNSHLLNVSSRPY